MTSRPAALSGPALPMGFNIVEIEPLDEPAMEAFLSRWSSALYQGVPEKSDHYHKELKRALTSRPEIRRMASNPVMLTALAVVHWNEHRLPEQRAELYESILTWLFRAREQREGRLKADLCRRLLQRLALAMFTHPEGRQRQAGLRWAAETLAPEFREPAGCSSVEAAEYFLRDEMIDSGIVVERNRRLEFWHLSFQEYLAAYEIGGHKDQEQLEMLFQNERLYSSEWREVVLLLAGVLYKQGLDKINNFIDSIIGKGPEQATRETLPLLAREVGLLGGMVRDLSPFEFKPYNPAYPGIVKGVMGIFDKETFRGIPVRVRIEAADALGSVGDPRLEGESNLWVSIPGGSFWMGAQKISRGERNYEEGAYPDESPVHCVELSLFSIGRYPVAVGQYLRFIEDGGYGKPELWQAGGFGEFKHPDKWDEQLEFRSRPVVYVSWYEAVAYASWCGCRLPTEAEWERAARGPGDEYRKYPWGRKEPGGETANFDKSTIGHATPVGIFPESCSPEGVIDMAGNVWEWCMDWFSEAYYEHCSKIGTVKDPRGPEKGTGRVVRGGSYGHLPDGLRCAVRGRGDPHNQFGDRGFRVVRGAQS